MVTTTAVAALWHPFASVARTLKLADAVAVVGVPLTTPALLKVSPAGSVPLATAYV
jgi:hypothetical protein